MDVRWIYFLWIILCSKVHHPRGENANSCQSIFRYQREGNESIGLVEIQSLPPWREKLKFEVTLSLPGQLPSQYVGSIGPSKTLKETIQKIRSNQFVEFTIRFPIQNPLPKLQQVSINGQAICREPPETGSLITEIRLYYTLFAEATDREQYHAIEQSYPSEPQLQNSEINATSQSRDGICGRQHEPEILSPDIVSNTIRRGAWPWLVTIYLNDNTGPKYHCDGSLISERTVVTAASCFRMANRTLHANEIGVLVGLQNIFDSTESSNEMGIVEELIIHKDFMTADTSYDADIALIIMRKSVKFTESVRPICLWDGNDVFQSIVNQYGTVIGWMRNNSGEITTSTPVKLTLPIVSNAECLRSNPLYRYVTSQRTFCAGDRSGKGLCNTDRGNGMMFQINRRWMLRGIFSLALSDPLTDGCNLNEYIVFTDAAKFVGWIKSLLR